MFKRIRRLLGITPSLKNSPEIATALSIKALADMIVESDGKPLDDKRVHAFETAIGAKLPEDYRQFLMLRNGGELQEELEFKYPNDAYAGGIGNVLVSRLFALDDAAEAPIGRLEASLQEMEYSVAGVPADLFVIGNDICGNLITIDLRNETYAQIGTIDHETIGDHFSDPETYFVVAPNFTAFVAALKDGDQE